MSKFWKKFDELMSLLPGEIDSYSSSYFSTKSTVIKKKTVNGKVVEDVVIVDGVRYVPETKRKDG